MYPTERLTEYGLSVKSPQSNEGKRHCNILWYMLRWRFGQTAVGAQRCARGMPTEVVRMKRNEPDQQVWGKSFKAEGPTDAKAWKSENLVYCRNRKYLGIVWAQRKSWVVDRKTEAGKVFDQVLHGSQGSVSLPHLAPNMYMTFWMLLFLSLRILGHLR